VLPLKPSVLRSVISPPLRLISPTEDSRPLRRTVEAR
jgi:hypothetical protein